MPSSFLLSSISYSKEVSYVVDEEPSKFVLKAQKRDPSGNCKVLDHTPKIYDNDSLLLVLFSWFSFIFVSLVVRFRRFFFFSFSFFSIFWSCQQFICTLHTFHLQRDLPDITSHSHHLMAINRWNANEWMRKWERKKLCMTPKSQLASRRHSTI